MGNDNDTHDGPIGRPGTPLSRQPITRRRFVRAAGAAGVAGLSGIGSAQEDEDNGDNESDEEGDTVVVEDKDVVVQLWSLLTGGDGDPFDALVEDFNDEHESYGVEVQRVTWDEYYDRLFTSMTAQEPPDIAFYHTAQMPQFVDTMVPLDEHVDFDPYLDNIAEGSEFDGTHYSLPLDMHPVATYYNKEIYEEAGLDPEQPPENWEEFVEANEAIADAGYNPYDAGTETTGLRVWLPWVRSQGIEPLIAHDDGSVEPNFNNEEGLTIMEAWQEMFAENEWALPEQEPNWQQFVEGEHGAITDGTWAYSRYREGGGEELDFDWGVYHPCVAPDREEKFTFGDSHTLGIPQNPSRTDDQFEAALAAIEYLTKDRSADWSINSGHLPATEEALESDELREAPVWDATMHLFYEMAMDDELYFHPPSDRTHEYGDALFQNIDAVRIGEKEPQPALDDAEQRIEQIWN